MVKAPRAAAVSAFAKAGAQSAPVPRKVRDIVEQYKVLKRQETALSDQLRAVTSAMNNIRTKLLVDAMKEAGAPKSELDDGTKIALSQFVSGSLPKEPKARKKALAWLRKNKGESLVVTEVFLAFTKGEANMAGNAVGLLKENGYSPTVEETVNTNSLQAFVRAALKGGAKVDLDALGMYAGETVKIKLKGEVDDA